MSMSERNGEKSCGFAAGQAEESKFNRIVQIGKAHAGSTKSKLRRKVRPRWSSGLVQEKSGKVDGFQSEAAIQVKPAKPA